MSVLCDTSRRQTRFYFIWSTNCVSVFKLASTFYLKLIFFPLCVAYRILVPQLGIVCSSCCGSTESSPLDCQGIPGVLTFKNWGFSFKRPLLMSSFNENHSAHILNGTVKVRHSDHMEPSFLHDQRSFLVPPCCSVISFTGHFPLSVWSREIVEFSSMI